MFEQQPPILATPPDDKVPQPSENGGVYIRGLFNVTGFRVPVMVVSPYSKPHFVWHQQTDTPASLS